MEHEEIAYQNKDITSKALAENFKGKTFRVYGLDLPEIRNVRPTNIPAVKANELRIDNLFELEDGTVALVDYESSYDESDKIKYLNYLTGIANRYQKEKRACPVLRMVVIYTGDIMREQVLNQYNIGAVQLNTDPAFLSELDSCTILKHLKDKVLRKEKLTEEELMELIIFPLAYREREEKEKNIHEAVDIAVKLQDRRQQVFALSGILAFTDKIIDSATAGKIRRAIEMTQVAMIFEEEKQQAVKQAVEAERKRAMDCKRQAVEAERKRAMDCERQAVEAERKRAMDCERQIMVKMIENGYPTEEIVFLMANYSKADVEALRNEIEK